MKKIFPCVIGLGYVGLPIFLRLQKKFKTLGFDSDKDRVKQLNRNFDKNNEFKFNQLKKKNLSAITDDKSLLKHCNFYIVAVPTPIFKNKEPNINSIISASKLILKNIQSGDLIFYESTVYPGLTEEISKKIFSKIKKIKMNKDFWIGYSPERINPGDKKNTIEKVKKIISFENVPQNVEKKIINLYKVITPNLVISRSIKEAETSKVIENIQRDINIAFMNEILVICDKLKINFNNVIKLASTKWNFLNFKPGLVGGHCLPVDPYYLYHLAKKRKLHAKFILAGRNVNNKMENFVLKKILNKIRSKRNCKNVLIAGLSFKSNVSDFRNSLALSIYKKLRKKKTIKVKAYDPYINTKVYKELGIIKKINFNKNKFDLIIFLVNHDAIRAKLIAYKNKFQIMDIFNFLKNN